MASLEECCAPVRRLAAAITWPARWAQAELPVYAMGALLKMTR